MARVPLPDVPKANTACVSGTSRTFREPVFSKSMGLPLQKQRFRVLDQVPDTREEAEGLGTVYDAVVVGECEVHHWPSDDFAVYDHGAFLNPVHPEDADLRSVEDRCAHEVAKNATVGDGERAPLQVLQLQFAVTTPPGELRHVRFYLGKALLVRLYLGKALLVRLAHHRDDEPLAGRERDPDVVVLLQD
jgi:hypothetical protein